MKLTPGKSYKFKDWSEKPGEEMFYLGYGELHIKQQLSGSWFKRTQVGHIFLPRFRTNIIYDNSTQMLVYATNRRT